MLTTDPGLGVLLRLRSVTASARGFGTATCVTALRAQAWVGAPAGSEEGAGVGVGRLTWESEDASCWLTCVHLEEIPNGHEVLENKNPYLQMA